MKGIFSFFFEVIKIVILAVVVVLPIRYFVFQPFIVKGASMEPNFQNNDYLIVDEISYRFRDPQRGEVIVFLSPDNPADRFIKRIIGLPYEGIKIFNGVIEITNTLGEKQILNELNYFPYEPNSSGNIEIVLAGDEYFVLGDNRAHSLDSRKFGAILEEKIIGKVFLRAWPVNAATIIVAPNY